MKVIRLTFCLTLPWCVCYFLKGLVYLKLQATCESLYVCKWSLGVGVDTEGQKWEFENKTKVFAQIL